MTVTGRNRAATEGIWSDFGRWPTAIFIPGQPGTEDWVQLSDGGGILQCTLCLTDFVYYFFGLVGEQ